MLLSASFTGKLKLVFVLTQEEAFYLEVLFESQKKEHRIFLKTLLTACLLLTACFYVTTIEILNVRNTKALKKIFWKTNIFFRKIECRLQLKLLRLKTQRFHTKLLCQEAILRQNRTERIKWIFLKERSFSGNYFILFKILFQFKNFL